MRRSTDEQDSISNDTYSFHIKITQFQSMLYVSSGEWQGWVLDYYRKYKNNPILNAAEELDFLKDNERNNRKLPPLVQMTYNQVDRYWFWLLDYLLWELAVDDKLNEYLEIVKLDSQYVKNIKNAIFEYHFRRNRSIEHLHPRHPQQEMDKWKGDESHLIRDSFGNLAMISSSFNSTQGNDSIGVKFARVKDRQILGDGKLESIKMLLMFLDAHGNDQEWLPDLVNQHGVKMYNLLTDFFTKAITTI